MAILLNRKYCSRIECLYYILQTNYKNFKENEFIISDVKFNSNLDYTVFDFCKLKQVTFGREYCPFLDNPLNQSKCYATQSVDSDSTKAKAASATVRGFEALGLVNATENGKFKISKRGKSFCDTNYESSKWLNIVTESVLSYGPVNGFLLKASEKESPFRSAEIYMSYPETDDPIPLSSSSTKDSNTWTVSMILSWCIAAGLIEPENDRNINNELPHLYYRGLLNKKNLSVRKFVLTDFAKNYLNSNPYVENPLSYSNLNKNVGSLRERNSKDIRELTIKYNHIVLKRRYALVYILNQAKDNHINLSFEDLNRIFSNHYDKFFLPNSDTWDILQSEINICPLAGLMIRLSPNSIDVLNTVNVNILSDGVSSDLTETINLMMGELWYIRQINTNQ